MAEGKASFTDIMLACKLAGEMIADVWETRRLVDDIKTDISSVCDAANTTEETIVECCNFVGTLIDERACDGKLYNTCIEQIINLLDDTLINMRVDDKTAENKYVVYSDIQDRLKSYLEVK